MAEIRDLARSMLLFNLAGKTSRLDLLWPTIGARAAR